MAKAGAFYGTFAWRQCRDAYMKKVNGLCEICLAAGLITPAEIVHHKQHLTDAELQDPNIALNFDNLQALCRKHHADQHPEIYGRQYRKRYTVDAAGHVIIDPTADAEI